MGDGGKGGGSNKASKTASRMAKDYYDDTDPMRQSMIGNFNDFMDGGYDVSENPVFGAGRDMIGDQYGVAKENIIGNTPRGGALTESMADLEMSRARSLTDLSAGVAGDEYNKAYGMATGAPQAAMGTLANIGGQKAMANAQESAGKMGALGDLGMGTGYFLGSK